MSRPTNEVTQRYHKKTYKQIQCLLRYDTESDIIEWLSRPDTPSPTQLLREIARDKMKEESK